MQKDPYLATKDIEIRKRLCIEHIQTHLILKNLSYNNYRKIHSLWYHRTIETFGAWRKAKKEALLQEDDPYLFTKNIEERKRLCIEHMRAHLTPDNMSVTWYKKKYYKWANRAIQVFKKWHIALQCAFTSQEIEIWEKHRTKKWTKAAIYAAGISSTSTKFKEVNIEETFVKEYIRLKSDSKFGRFSMNKYEKYRNKECPSVSTINVKYGSVKNFYTKITRMYPNIYFDPIQPFTDEDCEYALKKAYKDYGFISATILKSKGIYISSTVCDRRYGSLENACNKFNIPYKNPKQSKLFLQAKKEIEKLLPLKMIEEKEWPEWLFYKNPLSVDIFFPFFNLAIEVDGKQHYEKMAIFHIGRHDSFEEQQIRDKIKNIELPKHNITLIRIRYDEVKKIPENLKYYVELLKTVQEYCAY